MQFFAYLAKSACDLETLWIYGKLEKLVILGSGPSKYFERLIWPMYQPFQYQGSRTQTRDIEFLVTVNSLCTLGIQCLLSEYESLEIL